MQGHTDSTQRFGQNHVRMRTTSQPGQLQSRTEATMDSCFALVGLRLNAFSAGVYPNFCFLKNTFAYKENEILKIVAPYGGKHGNKSLVGLFVTVRTIKRVSFLCGLIQEEIK